MHGVTSTPPPNQQSPSSQPRQHIRQLQQPPRLAPQEHAVTRAGNAAYAERVGILSQKLIEDGFSADRAKRLAVLCASAIQGSLIQARVDRSGTPIETTADELAALLAAERPTT